VAHAASLDDRDRADRRVAYDRAIADELDRARVRMRLDRVDDAERREIDDREPGLGVAGDESVEGRSHEHSAPREGRGGGEGKKVATVHVSCYAVATAASPSLRCQVA